MKVGIISMHRILNYGSFMQAYALKSVVESFGHECSFHDFRKGEPRHRGQKAIPMTTGEKIKNIPKYLRNPLLFFRKKMFRKQFRDIFLNVCWPMLGVSSEMNYDLTSDVMIIGSDEVFNYTQNHAFGYVPCLFGHEIKARRIVSYAACAGYANISDIENDEMCKELSDGFGNFAKMSVRDRNTFDIVSRYSGKDPLMVLDPTLIYDFTWNNVRKAFSDKYIIVYAYEGRLDTENEVNTIRKFAKDNALRIISVGSFHSWCDENIAVPPTELLPLFAHAAFIVTDTFHGSIFSIKSKKKFVTLIKSNHILGSNENKVTFLLKQFGLEGRLINNIEAIEDHIYKDINYEKVFSIIDEQRKRSLQYLEECLSSIT